MGKKIEQVLYPGPVFDTKENIFQVIAHQNSPYTTPVAF